MAIILSLVRLGLQQAVVAVAGSQAALIYKVKTVVAVAVVWVALVRPLYWWELDHKVLTAAQDHPLDQETAVVAAVAWEL
jgi:hypothetical protein